MKIQVPVRNILLLALLAIGAARSQTASTNNPGSLPAGEVVEVIPLGKEGTESYAAYLAGTAQPGQPLPVLILFDPMARGALAVEVFREVAEAHGLLLVGSNASRNGPYERNFEIANRLFSEIFSKYPIDENRVFLSGFSGGSRLAASIAVLTGQVAGVIGCGAGFDSAAGYLPGPGAGFLYAGVVGNRDMNFPEMHHTRNWLEKLGIDNKLVVFEGGHRWPDPGELLRAMDWLVRAGQLRAKFPPGEGVAGAGLGRALDAARVYRDSGRLVDALREYRDIRLWYGDLLEPDSLSGKIEALETSQAYRAEAKRLEQILVAEEAWTTRFRELAAWYMDEGKGRGFKRWESAWSKFRKEFDAKEGGQVAEMRDRVEGFVFAFCIERANAHRASGQFELSLALSRLLTSGFPDRPYAWIRAAEDHARLRQDEAVFAALSEAVSQGFSNPQALRSNPAFAPYINRDAWHSLFAGIEEVP